MIKRDGERQRFDRTKLRAALLNAAHKRPVIASDIEAIVDRIETAVAETGGELSAERIGELCLDGAPRAGLGGLPPVRWNAAVRAASGGVRSGPGGGRFHPVRARGFGVPPKCRLKERT